MNNKQKETKNCIILYMILQLFCIYLYTHTHIYIIQNDIFAKSISFYKRLFLADIEITPIKDFLLMLNYLIKIIHRFV